MSSQCERNVRVCRCGKFWCCNSWCDDAMSAWIAAAWAARDAALFADSQRCCIRIGASSVMRHRTPAGGFARGRCGSTVASTMLDRTRNHCLTMCRARTSHGSGRCLRGEWYMRPKFAVFACSWCVRFYRIQIPQPRRSFRVVRPVRDAGKNGRVTIGEPLLHVVPAVMLGLKCSK